MSAARQAHGGTVTVRVALTFRKRGGRKLILAPDGAAWAPPPRALIDSTLLKALARAFRWRRMLESGAAATVTEIAARERINPSYVSRVLRLTLLAPDILEAILNGKHPPELALPRLMRGFPAEWASQPALLNKDSS